MKRRILVVDDEPQITHLLKLGLESLGYYDVHEVNESQRALAAARLFSPDLILLDLVMPDMDGSELLNDIVATPRFKSVPVIFLTALVTKGEVCNGSFVSGHRTYLPKPVDFPSLLHCIDETLDQQHVASDPVPVEAEALRFPAGHV